MRRSMRGAMNFGCLLLILGLGLVIGGGQGVWTAVTNMKPTEMSCADYVKQKPKATWLKLTGCFLDMTDAAWRESGGRIKEVYVPIKPADDKKAKQVHIMMATEDPSILDVASQLKNAKDEKSTIAVLIKNRDKIFMTKDLEGMVRFGVDLDSKDRDKLAGLSQNLSPDFVILSDGQKPTFLMSGGMLVGGLVLLAVAGLSMMKKSA